MKNDATILKKAGFTFIEILVVIVILGIIMAFLTAAIKGAVDSAKTVACMNNLRQIYMGIEMYAQDHNGNWIGDPGSGGARGSVVIWDFDQNIFGIGLLYNQYIDDLNAFYCPANKRMLKTRDNFGQPNKQCASDYMSWIYKGIYTLENLKSKVLVEDNLIPPNNKGPHKTKCNRLYGDGSVKLLDWNKR